MLILVGLLTPPQCHQRHQQRSGAAHAFSLGVVNPLRRTASTVSLRVQPSTASTAGAASSFVPIPSAPSTFFNNELFKSSEKALLHWPNGFNAETRTPRCPIIASVAPSTTPRLARYARKTLKSTGIALAWFLTSATLAGAAEAISAMPGAGVTASTAQLTYTKKHATGVRLGTIMCLYLLSSKTIKKRNRFEGVIPQDPESRQIIVDDAHEQAMSYGRPAGRVALLGVDVLTFALGFFYMGNELRKSAGVPASATVAPWNPLFWDMNSIFATFAGAALTTAVKVMGHGYIRFSLGVWLAPMALNFVVKPTKIMLALWGVGRDWDLGPTPEERMRMNEGKMTSRQLRESLSTFNDPTVAFREQDPHYHADGNYYDDEVEQEDRDAGDESPPDLRRSS